jgi:hypothetical protein
MKTNFILALALVSLLSACSTIIGERKSHPVADDDDYITGSNLPHREGAGSSKPESVTPEQIEEMRRRAATLPKT